ncbi:MAG: Arc family DNA binding domain-containing protein [Flavobacteriia bacterium]|nr:Arc family DNA binding domain-containing protein [Flavobacteriia bacterium]
MAKKKAFALRLDPDVHAALEKWATDEFRSANGQIEYLLHKALKEAGRLPKKWN